MAAEVWEPERKSTWGATLELVWVLKPIENARNRLVMLVYACVWPLTALVSALRRLRAAVPMTRRQEVSLSTA